MLTAGLDLCFIRSDKSKAFLLKNIFRRFHKTLQFMKLKLYQQWYDRILFIMKISSIQLVISMILGSVALANSSNGQGLLEREITVNAEDVELRQILEEVEKLALVKFAYSPRMIRVRQVVSVTANQEKLGEVLNKLLLPRSLSYKLIDGRILIYKSPAAGGKTGEISVSVPAVQVSGTVTDENGAALPGVNIIEKGTSNGVTTSADGQYSLSVEGENSILVFSFIGYASTEVLVGSQTTLNVTLAEDIKSLQEVVVIGYGEKSRRLMTESIGTVSSQEITRVPVTSADQAIQGRVSGVQVTSVDGTPGAPVAIRIRGVGTVGNTQPLFVIDGVPVGNNSNEVTNPLSTINPADIESITVLKDASASAVYGVRAANGVVLITTKRGKTGKPTISLDSYYGVQQIRKFNEYNSTEEWLSLTQEAYDNTNAQNNFQPGNPNFQFLHPDLAPGSPLRNQSNELAWREAALNTPAPIQNHNISISGGGENSNYFVSGGYFGQEATIRKWDLDRYTFRANADFKVNKRVRVGQTFTASYQEVYRGMNGGGDGFLLQNATVMPPFFNILEDPNDPIPGNRYGYDGNLDRAGLVIGNQVGINEIVYSTDRQTRLLGSVYAEVDIVSGLTFRTVASVDYSTSQNDRYRPEYLAPEMGLNRPLNEFVDNRGHSTSKVFTNTLNYNKNFGEHSFDVLAGIEYQSGRSSSIGVENFDFISTSPDFYRVVSTGRADPFITAGAGQGAFVGYIGRLSYNFREKYLFTGTVRRDGTSNFSPVDNRRWGTFPSFSAAWRISEENFFNTGFINELKLRAGWGRLGNSNTSAFPHIFRVSTTPDYALGGSNTVQAPVPINFVNEDVVWETVETIDVGFDMSMFNNKINVLAAFYDRTTKDFLFSLPLPALTGFQSTPVNLGKVNNRGIELEIGYNNTFKNGLTMQLSGNITTVRNRLVELAPGLEEFTSSDIYRTAIGQPIGYFFGYKTDGVWQTQEEIDAVFTGDFRDVNSPVGPVPGDVRFLDVNGPGEGEESQFSGAPDGIIDFNDRSYLGKTIPSYFYGFSANFGFKNFDLNFLFQGVGDVQVYNEVRRNGLNLNGGGRNMLIETQERWTGPGTSNSIPRAAATDFNANNRFSDRFVENAGFLRLRNIQLGYSLPQSLRERLDGFKSARVYVAATNLLTFTNYSGMDPEVMTYRENDNQIGSGTDRGNMPQPRIFQVGIQLSF